MSTTFDDLHAQLVDSVKRAARSASNTWYGLLDPDEIEQELWLQIFESPATAGKLEGSDPDLVTDLLARMADRICIQERADYEHFTGNYRYSVNEVKALAELFFVRTGEELLVDLVDFEVGFELLTETNPHYAEVVFRRYALGEAPAEKAQQHYLSKGLTKLTDHMNRHHKDREREYRDGPGTKPRIPGGYDPYEGH